MKAEIEVISRDIISPSSPTPTDVSKSNYKLSFLDQMSGIGLMPLFFFYKTTGSLSNSEISNNLKDSLSKTLSLYYPLAGRVVDNSYVDCNDEGITYIEAQAKCKLLDVINEHGTKELDKLLPGNLAVDVKDLCIIQATFFSCGGLAIGVAISHKLGDALSDFSFVNCWAAISRGDHAHIQSPLLDGATLLPPRSDLVGFDPRKWMISKEDIITKRFMFTASKINFLRDKYPNTTRATRIEALIAFIWTRFIVSTQKKDDLLKRIYTLDHAVNIRKRVDPPLSDYLFGNYIEKAIAVLSINDVEQDTNYQIIEKMREAILSIGGKDYLTKLKERNQTLNSTNDKANKYVNGEIVPFTFTSLCRFPLFEADFGWGKPVKTGFGSFRRKNMVALIDSFSGDGIEAWITLKVEDMAKFEGDEEFLAHATT